jgi:hypothetical protein
MKMRFLSVILAVPAMLVALASPAAADSPLTSSSPIVRRAPHVVAKVGPAPYTGNNVKPHVAWNTVTNGAEAVRETGAHPAIGLAIIHRVDSAELNSEQRGVTSAFVRQLILMKKQAAPGDVALKNRISLLQGVAKSLRSPDDPRAVSMVDNAVKKAPEDAGVQVLGGLAAAQKGNWADAAFRITRAKNLMNAAPAAKRDHATVQLLQSAEEYLAYYPEFGAAMKQVVVPVARPQLPAPSDLPTH